MSEPTDNPVTNIPGLVVEGWDGCGRPQDFEYEVLPEGLAFFNRMVGQEINWTGPSEWEEDGTSFGNAGAWLLTEKLSEQVHQADWDPICEAKAVFGCRKVSGDEVGLEGILKVFVQLPRLDRNTGQAPPEWKPHPDDASNYDNEVGNLKMLTLVECPIAPKLYHWLWTTQEHEESPLPGGYLGMLLMQRIPGKDLRRFWDMPSEKRELIRQVFIKSFSLIQQLVFLRDPALRNLVWVDSEQKLYFVDFEKTTNPQPYPVDDFDLDSWNLLVRLPRTGDIVKK